MLRLIFLTTLIAISVTLNAQSKIRLIGFEVGYEYSRYDKVLGGSDEYNESNLSGVTPASYIFYNNVGSPYTQIQNSNQAVLGNFTYGYQKNYARQNNLIGLFQIKNKEGKYNPKHIFKVGIGYQKRQLLRGQFQSYLGNTIVDTTGMVIYSGDTLPVINYTNTVGTSYSEVKTKQVKINIGYQYSFFSMDKANVKIGMGVDIGYTYHAFFVGMNSVFNITNSYAGGLYAGAFYNTSNRTGFSRSFSGSFSVRPYADLTVNWRLSKTNKSLDNINLFATARIGYDCIKLKQSKTYGDLFVSTTFGISYIFDKYYKS